MRTSYRVRIRENDTIEFYLIYATDEHEAVSEIGQMHESDFYEVEEVDLHDTNDVPWVLNSLETIERPFEPNWKWDQEKQDYFPFDPENIGVTVEVEDYEVGDVAGPSADKV